ncbi:hypothetical protein XELAEV_18006606mg [Xenopus laevis]|uniref:Uncharacterized protein n=1 Tax=Xenopus laevis TaxID=8355 RepID=A0A974DZL0_XENLA|nr:hypothetical protein XELAEV_18006606mg [Xenopus laevis]
MKAQVFRMEPVRLPGSVAQSVVGIFHWRPAALCIMILVPLFAQRAKHIFCFPSFTQKPGGMGIFISLIYFLIFL